MQNLYGIPVSRLDRRLIIAGLFGIVPQNKMRWNSFDLDVSETGDARRMYARKVSLQLFVKLQIVRKQFVSFLDTVPIITSVFFIC